MMESYAGQRLETPCVFGWIRFALLGLIISVFIQGALCDLEPTESQCRPYIEKALKEQHIEVEERAFEKAVSNDLNSAQEEFSPTDELTDSTEGSVTKDEGNDDDNDDNEDDAKMKRKDENEEDDKEDGKAEEIDDADEEEDIKTEEQGDNDEGNDGGKNESIPKTEENEQENDDEEDQGDDDQKEDKESVENPQTESDQPVDEIDNEVKADEKAEEKETEDADDEGVDLDPEHRIEIDVQEIEMDDNDENDENDDNDGESVKDDRAEGQTEDDDRTEGQTEDDDRTEGQTEDDDRTEGQTEDDDQESDVEKDQENGDDATKVDVGQGNDTNVDEDEEERVDKDDVDVDVDDKDENKVSGPEEEGKDRTEENDDDDADEKKGQDDADDETSDDDVDEKIEKAEDEKSETEGAAENEEAEGDNDEAPEEEELIKEMVIPENLRPRNHIDKILKLEDSDVETVLEKTIDTTLKALKTLYDSAIKPLELLYKYRDLSNRHFGDPEIFSKPLILFMGPWSGGKSSTINYLLDNEFSHTSLRTGAEPSPAYFNILMHGEEEEILDGTQLAADWTFSGLQKFGQSLLDRLKGIKMPNKLLEKVIVNIFRRVNIVEIPGILEIRKQVQRLFPFNDACQWFIDRADIIFLVYDPSKLDVGPETEAILDQLKGREYQTRIILNKADQVKPEELMRVQGTLIWNISPLMSSSEPPIMYSTSLWSLPYEIGAPTRLLQAQERAFLKDLREAIDKRVEHKIASARRFAVRVRNHAKMVDCYLTTYYNHKTIFGNRKRISDDIIEYPQKYHIYEGLSTLTNISRYDLPDPDMYKDFFKINPLYEFKKLSETCTYFRGCPINKLDVVIAYDLPELIGKYKKAVETAKEQLPKANS